MPHIFVEKFDKNIEFPVKVDGVEFLFRAEELVACEVDGRRFFLSVREKNGKTLIKYDKITRPLLEDLKEAYQAFIKLTDSKIIFSNLGEMRDNKVDEFLMNPDDEFKFDDMMLEVGFGSGRHLLHLAKTNRDKTIIGIEIHQPSIEQVLKRVKSEKLTNVRIINFDARLLLSKLPSNRLSGIFVHFPVPWDKKPHRRVISIDFINESIRTLKKNGVLHLRTDSDNYFEYSFAEFMKLNKNNLQIYKNRDLEVSSKYEDRWKKLQKNIYDIILSNEEISDDIDLNYDFSFDKPISDENISFKPFVFNGFVVHFEKVFKIDENRSVIKLTMGAFDRPEHLYLVTGADPYYFKNPLSLKKSYEAHQEIKRLLSAK